MLPENAIEVKNVTKKFKVYFDKGYQLKEKVLFSRRNRYDERFVLQNISFEVRKGEAIGLIGNNGCGKSTTLKLLTKIIYPDCGTIEMKGRVSSIIELGAGFHPDMSGRENIYTNAAIFGLTRKEIDERIAEIIEFSELDAYIDNPVRTYSSGMYMRLAFSVAINVDAEILLIDEILAVGDAHFQAKCFNRLREIKASGTTIVIVSHSTSQIEQICDKAIWIKDGKVEKMGMPRDVIQIYMAWVMGKEHMGRKKDDGKDKKTADKNKPNEEKTGNKTEGTQSFVYTEKDIIELKKNGKLVEVGSRALEITDYELLDAQTKDHKMQFGIGESILLRVYYQRHDDAIKETMFSLAVYRNDGLNCYSTNCFINTGKNMILKNEGMLELTIKNQPFMQGVYKLDISFNKDYGPTYHGYLNACEFEVYNITTDYGVCRPDIDWNLDAVTQSDKDWEEQKPEKILKINQQSAETIEMPFKEDYDMVIIERSIYEIRAVKSIVLHAIEHTTYLLVQNRQFRYFEEKVPNSKVMENNGQKEIRIFMSTKNRAVVSDIINDMQEEACESKWLLDCFKEKIFSFDVIENQMEDSLKPDQYVICLGNHTNKIIRILDHETAFSYHYFEDEKYAEGSRSKIREKIYPGQNYYKLDASAAKGCEIFVSIVKEKEY